MRSLSGDTSGMSVPGIRLPCWASGASLTSHSAACRLSQRISRIPVDFRVVRQQPSGPRRDIIRDLLCSPDRPISPASWKGGVPAGHHRVLFGGHPSDDSTSGLPHIRTRIQRRRLRRNHGEHSYHQNHPPPSLELSMRRFNRDPNSPPRDKIRKCLRRLRRV